MKKPIGRIIATEKVPTTMDKFTFWTDSDLKLHAFDIVKVKHIDDSYSFGVIENISHITDAQSFLTSFISSDFGDVTVDEPTLRVGMNYVEASVSYNNKNLYTPVHNNEPVYLASENEITMALGLDKIQNPLVCGSLKMYEGTSEEITLPVNLNSKFILGPEGAHLRPLRIAFDHYEQSEVYISAVKKAAKYGIMELSNYLLYNFEDEPKELYYRMRINVDLCEELGVTIYSFPMKYHPINDPEYFKNRDYLGKHWNRKFIRAVQAVLNSTKGKIGKGIEFFEEAFGRDLDEFYKILWMPETFIIYRRKYDKKLRERLADRYKNHSSEDCDLANEWWTKFCSLPAEKLEIAKSIISLNKFKEGDYDCTDKEILDVLSYYSITRDIAEQSI